MNQVEAWRSIIVVPITTSKRQAMRHLTTVPLGAGDAGLKHDSIALCHQVTTLDRSKFSASIGLLPVHALAAVEKGLIVALDLSAT